MLNGNIHIHTYIQPIFGISLKNHNIYYVTKKWLIFLMKLADSSQKKVGNSV